MALTTFIVGLCVVPMVKNFLHSRDERKRLQILGGSGGDTTLESLLAIPALKSASKPPGNPYLQLS